MATGGNSKIDDSWIGKIKKTTNSGGISFNSAPNNNQNTYTPVGFTPAAYTTPNGTPLNNLPSSSLSNNTTTTTIVYSSGGVNSVF